MDSISFGQHHYQWETTTYTWLQAIECTIYNISDPSQSLAIVLPDKNAQICTPNNVKSWVEFATRQGWKGGVGVYKIFEINQQTRISSLAHSLKQENQIAENLAKKFNKTTSALEKSEIKYQLERLEKALNLTLPTVLKLLYLHLGNGDFGPDYGFYALTENAKIKNQKITIAQAYKALHSEKIKDWDWELPQLLVPILYWGTDIYSLIDLSSPSAPVYVLDKNLKKEQGTWQSCYWLHCNSMMEWLQKWSEGDASGRDLWLGMYRVKGLI